MYAILAQQLRGELDSKLVQQLNHYQQMVASVADEQALGAATEDYLSGPQSNSLRQSAYIFSMQTLSLIHI